MTTKVVKSISITIVAVVIIFMLSFGYYNFIYKPAKVIESVNENVSILNRNLTQTQQVIDNINFKYIAVNEVDITDSQNVQIANTQLKEEVGNLDQIIEKNSNDKDAIEEGVNQETKSFAKLSIDSLEKRNSILDAIKNVINFDTCLNENYFSLLNYNSLASESILKLNELVLNSENTEEIISINNSAIVNLENAITSFNNIEICIEESQKDLIPEANSQLIRNDVLAYQNFIESLKSFNQGLAEDNIDLINNSQANLDNNSLTSQFLKENMYQQNILSTNEIISEKYQELKDVENSIDEKIDEIKDEYNFETT